MISAGTVAEALIVAARRNVGEEEMTRLIEGVGFEIVSVTPASARRIAAAYARWEEARTRPGLILAIASPTKSPRSIPAPCFMSAMIFRKRSGKRPLRQFRDQAEISAICLVGAFGVTIQTDPKFAFSRFGNK